MRVVAALAAFGGVAVGASRFPVAQSADVTWKSSVASDSWTPADVCA
jgi:hypothetical protein